MDRFKVSTKKSLFKPIEVEVDGVVYSVDMITADMIEKVTKFDKGAKGGDMTAVMEQLELLIGIPTKIAKKLDVRDLEKMMTYVSAKIFNPGKYEVEEEKNGSGVVETPSKSS